MTGEIMEYAKGSIGRVFTVRMEHGDDILHELEGLAKKENIDYAMFVLLGAIKEADLVVGPKENMVPPDPQWDKLRDVNEVIGVGNIFLENGSPKIHLHLAAGRGDESRLVSLSNASSVFMVVEIFIMEIDGINASRQFDESKGFAPITFI